MHIATIQPCLSLRQAQVAFAVCVLFFYFLLLPSARKVSQPRGTLATSGFPPRGAKPTLHFFFPLRECVRALCALPLEYKKRGREKKEEKNARPPRCFSKRGCIFKVK